MTFLKIETLPSDLSIQIVSLNRPDVRNAFHPGMIQEITVTFQKFNQDSKIKAVILRGEGTAFCSGADLNWMKEMVQYSFEENITDSEKLWAMFEAVAFCSVPVIGVVHGAVFGGALGLVAACDYVFSEAQTKFCFSEVKLGLAPAVISSFVLRKVSDGHARGLMISADVFLTEKAQAVGLTHSTFTGTADLVTLMKSISTNGIEAMKETKKLLNEISKADWPSQKKITTKVISERRMSAEGQERLKKFVEKS
ncbi:MAG: enoyl-CoA hydratase/isomerase family protein [Bdellovibrio sp.]|nr:enoyl-CoA hydratase/isomerase family protein [Bdellovibrio sp.]